MSGIRVDAWIDDARLVVTVGDEGHGIVPRPDSPGLGLGLPLIARLTQRCEIESPRTRREHACA